MDQLKWRIEFRSSAGFTRTMIFVALIQICSCADVESARFESEDIEPTSHRLYSNKRLALRQDPRQTRVKLRAISPLEVPGRRPWASKRGTRMGTPERVEMAPRAGLEPATWWL